MRFSIIIPNYNYGPFVGNAIQSALDVDWPNVEVIVVDDGSTDNSRAVIEAFGTRITAIFQANSTHRVACNMGFAQSTGDAIIFLDSDDMLLPSVATEVAAVWTDQVSKVQFQMMRVDVNGHTAGRIFPQYNRTPTPEAIRDWAKNTTAYPTPPGSGNAYARKFLEKLFPVDDSCGAFFDSACLAAAPFLGDVITIVKPLVLYRIHGRNDSNLLSDPRRFGREVARAEARWRFARRIAKVAGFELNEQNLFKSMHLLQLRVASLRVSPDLHPLANDSRKRAMHDTFRAMLWFPAASLKDRMIIGMWAILTLAAPKQLALCLITLRFKPIEIGNLTAKKAAPASKTSLTIKRKESPINSVVSQNALLLHADIALIETATGDRAPDLSEVATGKPVHEMLSDRRISVRSHVRPGWAERTGDGGRAIREPNAVIVRQAERD